MSFTQENETNPHAGADSTICDGCERRCKLGFHWFYVWSSSKDRGISKCCPTIGGQAISQYKDENNQIVDAVRDYCYSTFIDMYRARKQINELAHEIVKFCDHYKTR
ncbi:MAG: hypothetical protein IJX89_01320, partial [Alphaproteobacteria bacterium]|nr:hypothetical protein [Alphaproteobacteria bacterium]